MHICKHIYCVLFTCCVKSIVGIEQFVDYDQLLYITDGMDGKYQNEQRTG